VLHRERKPEVEGMQGDLLYDGKRTSPLEIQFLGRVMSPKVACIEPDFVTNGKGQNGGMLGLGTGLVLGTGDLELLVEEPVDVS